MDDSARVIEQASASGATAANSARPAICIVDDDEAARDSLALLLRVHGYPVQTHETGQGLLSDPKIDSYGCIVLDMHMPIMTGLELLEVLRNRRIDVPAIFISGLVQPALAERAIAAKASAFLAKPVAEDELLASIGRACSSRG